MNIINNNINWEYRYIECSLNKIGIPNIEKINSWISAKNITVNIKKNKFIIK